MIARKAVVAAIVSSAMLPSCGYYASIAVAPNGVVWVAKNSGGGLGGAPQAEGIYACVPHGLELQCTRMPTRGMDD